MSDAQKSLNPAASPSADGRYPARAERILGTILLAAFVVFLVDMLRSDWFHTRILSSDIGPVVFPEVTLALWGIPAIVLIVRPGRQSPGVANDLLLGISVAAFCIGFFLLYQAFGAFVSTFVALMVGMRFLNVTPLSKVLAISGGTAVILQGLAKIAEYL